MGGGSSVRAEEADVLAEAREQSACCAQLHAQRVDHVGVGKRLAQVGSRGPLRPPRRASGSPGRTAYLRAKQAQDIAAAAVCSRRPDGDPHPVSPRQVAAQFTDVAADGERVERGLGRIISVVPALM